MRVFWDPVQLRHHPRFFLQRGLVRPNFEVPARAAALLDGVRGARARRPRRRRTPGSTPWRRCTARPISNSCATARPRGRRCRSTGPELVPNIHPAPEMVANGAQPGPTVIGRLGWFTADTSCPIAPETWPAALAAAAGALAAADEAAAGRHAYALARPPGHHAYAARAGGHCYVNNAALAAERLRARGADRVAVLDIDSHHGNGTQGIFWDRADVLFVSLHGNPAGYYPWYVGHAEERGAGAGARLQPELPAAARRRRRSLARRAGRRARGHPRLRRRTRWCSASASTPASTSRSATCGSRRTASPGPAQRIAALGLPTAIVQEGGYNTDLLGALLERTLGPFN